MDVMEEEAFVSAILRLLRLPSFTHAARTLTQPSTITTQKHLGIIAWVQRKTQLRDQMV